MKLIRKIAFLAFAFAVMMSSSNPLLAQNKYGHLNYGNLLDQIPEVKSGDTQLATFRGDQVTMQQSLEDIRRDLGELKGDLGVSTTRINETFVSVTDEMNNKIAANFLSMQELAYRLDAPLFG